MRRKLFFVGMALAIAVAASVFWYLPKLEAQKLVKASSGSTKPPASPLPITQVILFNSGVGYFQREGEVEESTRVDLSFPASDINDLLKSLVLQDLNGGQVASVSYDSHDPIEKTLKSFALDLTANPTFGQILNQARGERIEVTLQQSNNNLPNPITGKIVGMESQQQPNEKGALVEVHLLNLLCDEGMRSVPISQVLRVRFLNPVLDSEFKRALDVLASTHDTQKKTVSLGFSGDGKRTVRVGYVVENPIWKTSYRLVLDRDGKPFLQGWAVVENTSDDDWSNVRMVLVSGRPISFQMNLYQPLYIPRPTVEPELFASLRPPTYSGALVGGQMGDQPAGGMLGGVAGPQNLGGGGGGQNYFGLVRPDLNRYQQNSGLNNFAQLGNLGGQFGQQGGNNSISVNTSANNDNRLTFEELQKRRQIQQDAKGKAHMMGSKLATMDPNQSIASVASAEEIGDYFQYVIDHKVSLPRQKSALLPIVHQPVEATKVSIFNEAVHTKFPLLGLKFKNTSGQHLMQGPITVFEGGSFAGDARIMDLVPNEERLLSYSIDLGTEVKAEAKSAPQQLTAVKIVKGVLQATNKLRETRTYLIKNRTDHDRVVLVEHPYRNDWKLVTPEKPSERSRDVYRFQVNVAAGKLATQSVVEEQTLQRHVALLGTDDQTVRLFISTPVASSAVKESLKKAMDLRAKLAVTQRDLGQVSVQLKAITDDQVRLRANLEKVPATSAAYKRYLEKFDTQETEIEKLQTQIKGYQETEKKDKKEYEDFLAGLSVE